MVLFKYDHTDFYILTKIPQPSSLHLLSSVTLSLFARPSLCCSFSFFCLFLFPFPKRALSLFLSTLLPPTVPLRLPSPSPSFSFRAVFFKENARLKRHVKFTSAVRLLNSECIDLIMCMLVQVSPPHPQPSMQTLFSPPLQELSAVKSPLKQATCNDLLLKGISTHWLRAGVLNTTHQSMSHAAKAG